MPKIAYEEWNPEPATMRIIQQANAIIVDYQRQGFALSLRQLYYQFVARDLIRNKQSEYNRLGLIINKARLAGFVDWNAIEDRTRDLVSVSHWGEPGDIIRSAASSFRNDKWEDQPTRVEVWVEKDALTGVIDPICRELDLAYFSCRGYTSQSEMWKAGAQRFSGYVGDGQWVVLLHLGDHDPSGIDMSRDIRDRITTFMEGNSGMFELQRLALNEDQVRQYDPPPNPVKMTDSRSEGYQARFGDTSWELDALEPSILAALIRSAVTEYRDDDLWQEAVEKEEKHRKALTLASSRWAEVATYLEGGANA